MVYISYSREIKISDQIKYLYLLWRLQSYTAICTHYRGIGSDGTWMVSEDLLDYTSNYTNTCPNHNRQNANNTHSSPAKHSVYVYMVI